MLDSRGLLGSFKWLVFFSSKSTVMVWLLFTHPSVLLTYPWVFYVLSIPVQTQQLQLTILDFVNCGQVLVCFR